MARDAQRMARTLKAHACRTHLRQGPSDDPEATASRGGWRHLPLRTAYFRLDCLFQDGSLFRFRGAGLTIPALVPRNSNRLEEGVNASLKHMVRQPPRSAHRTHATRLRMALLCEQPQPRSRECVQGTRHERPTAIGLDGDNELSSQPTFGTGIGWNEFHASN